MIHKLPSYVDPKETAAVMYLLSLIHNQQRTRSVDGGGDRRGGVQGNAVSPVGHTAHIRASTILAAHIHQSV